MLLLNIIIKIIILSLSLFIYIYIYLFYKSLYTVYLKPVAHCVKYWGFDNAAHHKYNSYLITWTVFF